MHFFRNFLVLVSVLILAACTSSGVDQALTPQQISSAPLPAPTATAAALPANGQAQTAIGYAPVQNDGVNQATANQVAALDLGKSVTFLPIEGAPQSAATNLSNSIKSRAQIHGLNLQPSAQTSSEYQIKGYFTALNDGTGTLLVYIWDVLDKNGNRLHRINGRERSGSTNINPWQAITNKELTAVADITTAKLRSWIEARA